MDRRTTDRDKASRSGWLAGSMIVALGLGGYWIFGEMEISRRIVAPDTSLRTSALERQLLARLDQQTKLLDDLASRLARVESQVAVTRMAKSRAPASATADAGQHAKAASDGAGQLEIQLAAARQQAREQNESLDSRWAGELPDAQWAPMQEQALNSQIGAAEAFKSLMLSEVNCKATLCRLVIDGADLDPAQLSSRLSSLDAFRDTEFRISDREGTQLVIHLARPGEHLFSLRPY
ncbi:MAG: hypothetical protein H6R26_911 [Proteobacteria bacterium]|nr:hypothetical protein [Pseudomonadota bacterium]